MAKILISGGKGMLGQNISRILIQRGHEVAWLTRKTQVVDGIRSYTWDPVNRTVDANAFKGVQHLIHLSGNNIGEKAWTKAYKKEILDSRIRGAEFLFECYKNYKFPLESFTGVSAIGYYGSQPIEESMEEADPAGTDFLAQVCVLWENSYKAFENSGVRTNILRLGIVLSKSGGMYAKLRFPFAHGFGVVLGDGKNYISWIHEKDAASIFCFFIENNSIKGIYNAVSSAPISSLAFCRSLAASFGKKIWLPRLPAFLIKMFIGERSAIILGGRKVINQKLLSTGFQFRFNKLDEALKDLHTQ